LCEKWERVSHKKEVIGRDNTTNLSTGEHAGPQEKNSQNN